MLKCLACDRQFASKGALTRHEQNHKKTHQHTCPQCQVTFYRPDLLTRHLRMHNKTGTDGTGGRKRLRTRTACEACRRARTKCNGQSPCSRCQKNNLICSFTPNKGRVSTDLRVAEISSSSPLEGMFIESVQGTDAEQTSSSTTTRPMDTLQDDNSCATNAGISNDGLNEEEAQTVISPHAIPWSWLHEDIFLQTDINLDWYDVPDLITAANESSMTNDYDVLQDMDLTFSNHEGYTITGHEQNQQQQNVSREHNHAFHDATPNTSKVELVDRIVEEASMLTKQIFTNHDTSAAIRSFESMVAIEAARIPAVFQFDARTQYAGAENPPQHCLQDFIELYLKHFWTLWPLFPQYKCKEHKFQPLLYLAMASIGAMYGDKKTSVFGAMLHESLRDVLLRPLYDFDVSDRDLLPLGQARSLTQAAALYFGQKRAFSYAQHIGGILVSQGRKMNIFSQQSSTLVNEHDNRTDDQRLNSWIRKECCKRLAFAILRLEMYTSTLHSTRPLISAEEMDIELPCSRFLWNGDFPSSKDFINAVKQEKSMQQPRILFSDLVRLALDPRERLPQLDFLDQELLMNAMQEHVWRACVARESFERLVPMESAFEIDLESGFKDDYDTGQSCRSARTNTESRPNVADSHLIRYVRAMSTLRRTNLEVSMALRKWHESCSSSEVPSQVIDRSSLLSCFLMYHTGFLQLHAPLELVHTICHLPLSKGISRQDAFTKVRSWSMTERSLVAVRHAMSIFKLLQCEARRDRQCRASVNYLTMIGLYHSAALLWVYSGIADCDPSETHLASNQCNLELDCGDSRIRLSKANGSLLMDAFVTLFYNINPAWAPRSSFCAAVQRLSKLEFPQD